MNNILNKLKLGKNKLLLIGIILIVIIGIPLTIMQSQKQQEIRQRAAGLDTDVSLVLVRPDEATIELGDQFPIEILLRNSKQLDISGFMITINYNHEFLELSKFSRELGKPKSGEFDPIIIDSTTPGIIQYAAVNSDVELEIDDDDILIGTLTFQGIATGSANVIFGKTDDKTQVTALEKETALEVTFQDDQTFQIVPIPEKSIAVDIVVKIDGILSPPPETSGRAFIIRPVDGGEFKLEKNIEFDDRTDSFEGTINIPEGFVAGNYTIETKNSLRKLIGFIDPSKDIEIAEITLALGDVKKDNKIDILDFNIIRDCFGEKFSSSECTKAHTEDERSRADLDESGKVDGTDYNLFVRALAIREGD